MTKASKAVFISVGAFVLIILVFFAVSFYKEMKLQITLGPVIKKEFGFDTDSPYIRINGSRGEVGTIVNIKPGGVFDKAGFLENDILREPYLFGDLYLLLDSSRGKTVTIKVVPGGDGPPLKKRKVRAIKFLVPEKDNSINDSQPR